MAYRAWFEGRQVSTWNAKYPKFWQVLQCTPGMVCDGTLLTRVQCRTHHQILGSNTSMFGHSNHPLLDIFQVAGWTQVYGDTLSFATIRGAAHEAPFSQPERSLVLLKTFLEGKPLPGLLSKS